MMHRILIGINYYVDILAEFILWAIVRFTKTFFLIIPALR